MQTHTDIKISMSKQDDGRWYGRIPNSDDGNGNEIDACLYTPMQTAICLLEQL
jgi:hypothetical protein